MTAVMAVVMMIIVILLLVLVNHVHCQDCCDILAREQTFGSRCGNSLPIDPPVRSQSVWRDRVQWHSGHDEDAEVGVTVLMTMMVVNILG